VSNHSLENAVMQALADNPGVHADEIAVEAIDSAVILRGTVGTVVQKMEAARTARGVIGVQTVEDRLAIRPMGIDARSDADTQAAVLAALIDDDELNATDINVKAHDGSVTLSGLVELPSARDRAERTALAVGGVSCVHNRLKVMVPIAADDPLRLPGSPRPAHRR